MGQRVVNLKAASPLRRRGQERMPVLRDRQKKPVNPRSILGILGAGVLGLMAVIWLWSRFGFDFTQTAATATRTALAAAPTALPASPSATATRAIALSTATEIFPTSTPAPRCVSWETVTRQAIRQRLCVYGVVVGIFREEQTYYIRFGTRAGEFYAVSYGKNLAEGYKGQCIEFEGVVQQIGSSPVMVLEKSSSLRACQPDILP